MSDALMTETSRRSFLKGFASALVATGALPVVAKLSPVRLAYDEWIMAIGPVYDAYLNDIIVYGIGAMQTISAYPYIRRVSPQEIVQDDQRFATIRGECDSQYGESLVCIPTEKGKRL